MLRIERDPMGMGGRALYVSAPADLEELDAKSARLVSPRVRSLFEGFPGSVTALAEDAPVPAMGEWLRSLADASCTLEVYDTELFGKDGQEVLGFETLAETLRAEPALGSYRAFYDLDGDWLCTSPDGSATRWIGGEWCDGPVQPARSLREMLEALFASLARRAYFRPDTPAG